MVIKKVAKDDIEKNIRTIIPAKIIGIDSSSLGIAWTCLYDTELYGQGKIHLEKIKTIDQKLAFIYQEWQLLLEDIQPDYIFIEKSIFVKNPATARTLSYVVGTVMAISAGMGYSIYDVEPATWKSFFGYRNLNAKFVMQIYKSIGNTEGKKFCDKLRKSQTWRVIQHNYPADTADSLGTHDNDIADSWGIALWGAAHMGVPIALEINDSIRLDQDELARLGVAL